MSGWNSEDDTASVGIRYEGVPDRPQIPEEKSRWQKFLEWMMPWAKKKWDMGEMVLEAKARKEVADAKTAEQRAKQEALKTIRLAKEIESSILEELPGADDSVVDQRMAELMARVDRLSLTHGTKIDVRRLPAGSGGILALGSGSGPDSIEEAD